MVNVIQHMHTALILKDKMKLSVIWINIWRQCGLAKEKYDAISKGYFIM